MPTTRPRATRPQHASATRPMWSAPNHTSETRPTSDASATRPGRRPPQACVPTTLNLQAVGSDFSATIFAKPMRASSKNGVYRQTRRVPEG